MAEKSRKVGGSAGNRGKGRKKGVPNKFTGTLKEMILNALEGAHEGGGIEYLKGQAKDNPAAFLSLVGKVLPMTVAGDPENPLKTVTVVELVAPGHRESSD